MRAHVDELDAAVHKADCCSKKLSAIIHSNNYPLRRTRRICRVTHEPVGGVVEHLTNTFERSGRTRHFAKAKGVVAAANEAVGLATATRRIHRIRGRGYAPP